MRRDLVSVATLSAVLLIAGSHVVLGQTQKPAQPQGKNVVSPEWQRVLEGLKQARPMPMPEPTRAYPTIKTPSGDLMKLSVKTGQVTSSPPAEFGKPTGVQQENPGLKPKPSKGKPVAHTPSDAHDRISLEQSQVGEERKAPATLPSPVYFPYSFPFNTIARLLGRWNVNGQDYYWLCTAETASSYFLISAGHCVYNHDPTGDHSGTGAGFAAEMWAWPAETDVVDPIDPVNWPDFPYGVVKATGLTTYNAWINNSDLNWDFSFISVDRRIGDHAGWMGREWNTQTTALNFDGYAAETPYVPPNNPFQYFGFDPNNVAYYTCCRIGMFAYVYGGMSGGPDWRYDGTSRWIEGVNSTSDRNGNAEATLLTGQIESDLENTIANTGPPTDLAQTIEYVFNGTSKGLGQTSTEIGSSFPMTLNAFNAGYADGGDTWADVYLTKDSNNITSGYYVGTYDFGGLGGYTYTVQNGYFTIPVSLPQDNTQDTWYVGYVLNSANPQYGTDKNTVVITAQTMTAYCNLDGYEPDNFFNQASLLIAGNSQTHSICPRADQDWAYFTVSRTSGATIWTEGPSGDTTMTLYDSNLNQIDFNDDNGHDLFSTINRVCGVNPLPAGTYYVLIQSYHNATVIPTYTLSLSQNTCPSATTTTLVSSRNPSVFGTAVTFTATVTSSTQGTITGTVTFMDGATVLGTSALSLGHATFTTSALGGGAHSITAVYSGDANYLSSTSAVLMQTVKKAGSTTALVSSKNPSVFGAAVTFAATVHSSTTGIPTGSVTFKDGATVLGSRSLVAGKATFTTSTLAVGSHSITAVYGGSTNFTASTSPAITQAVTKAATTTTLVSSKNPSVFGAAVTFTTTVHSSTTGIPTGSVTFRNGATVLGARTLSAGKAKFTTSTLTVGSHSITAVYGGSADFTGSTSPVLTQKVNP